MSHTILLTGANGHLGANTARALLAKGCTVKAFVRKTSDLRGLAGLDIQYAYGDIRDKASVMEAVKGCDVIIHQAAVYKIYA